MKTQVDAKKIWKEFVYLGGKSLYYKRKAQLLIPKLAENKIYLDYGFATLSEAASKIAGIGYETTRKILSTHRRTLEMPKLHKQLEKSGYNKVSMVLSLAPLVEEKELVKMVDTLPRQALRERVKDIQKEKGLFKGQTNLFEETEIQESSIGYQKPSTPIAKFTTELDDTSEQDLNLIRYNLEKETGHPITNQELFKHLLSLAKPQVKAKPKTEYPRANKTLTPKHKEHVKAQNNHIYEATGCNQVATEIHHENYQSLNPEHTNLKAYCKAHHQLAHFEISHKSPQQMRIDQKVQVYWVRT